MRASARARRRGAALAGACALTLSVALAGWGQDETESYCAEVSARQDELAGHLDEGGPDALLRALPVLEDLGEEAPGDLADEWHQVLGRLRALDSALREAGVDPASYDREEPPGDLSGAQRSAIDGAAGELVSERTAEAMAGLEQQARDVCKTPLVP
ncbi:hypothetical protein GHK92_10285 [Nocardioides sp. dk4132]|uniref:hypothetical protein n=1 Tax=unclassified Nocardioides TaxID=2615069 RepID=UPI001296F94F|nr:MULTISPECIES: hypothetical protein [unclassified Nocardioides]MQW76264.1 hypothetical protein [Nocardioides sp. dk4132]QGA07450.1 hypothetical protein GFH29_08640 [Nocardioides sp. dk884]